MIEHGHPMISHSTQSHSLSLEAVRRLSPVDLLVLSAWCGLVGGELDVAARIINRSLSSTPRLYLVTRHFVWVVPLVNLTLFLTLSVLLALTMRLFPIKFGWLCPRLIITLACFPVLMTADPNIYLEAWLLVAMGLALRVTPWLERSPSQWRRWLVRTTPFLVGLVVFQAGWLLSSDWLTQWREDARERPPKGSPNVLLIVLDTVRADHLGLFGYSRPTSPNLERLARRGIVFSQARAAAPWTLASHATFFTGRWPHELGIEWSGSLRRDVPTLAEHLGSLGYATAGFAGNTFYCSYDTGLDRGFTCFQDYVLNRLNAIRTVSMIDELLKATGSLERLLPATKFSLTLQKLSEIQRKSADIVNHQLLDWLSQRRQPQRPFFAFLNYVDAHAPYLVPRGVAYRFGSQSKTDAERRFLSEDWNKFNKQRLTPAGRTMVVDAYDSCLAYLDDRLGELIENLDHRGVLDQTFVIVTADHGEGLGEHGLFDHGESLYGTEIRVPLLFIPPGNRVHSPIAIDRFVSQRRPAGDRHGRARAQAELAISGPVTGPVLVGCCGRIPRRGTRECALRACGPNPLNPNQGRSPAHRGPLIALADGDFVYIRNESDGSEQLFDHRQDSAEVVNFAHIAAVEPVLKRFRDQLASGRARKRVDLDKSNQSTNIREYSRAKLFGQAP